MSMSTVDLYNLNPLLQVMGAGLALALLPLGGAEGAPTDTTSPSL